jgi:hypothetical protein
VIRLGSEIAAGVLSVGACVAMGFDLAGPVECFLALVVAALWRIEGRLGERP